MKQPEFICQLGAQLNKETRTVTLHMGTISDNLRGVFRAHMYLDADRSFSLESRVSPEVGSLTWNINGTSREYDKDRIATQCNSQPEAEKVYERLCDVIELADLIVLKKNRAFQAYNKRFLEATKAVREAANILQLQKEFTLGFEWESQNCENIKLGELERAHSRFVSELKVDEEAIEKAKTERAMKLFEDGGYSLASITCVDLHNNLLKNIAEKVFSSTSPGVTLELIQELNPKWNIDETGMSSTKVVLKFLTDSGHIDKKNPRYLMEAGFLDEDQKDLVIERTKESVSINKAKYKIGYKSFDEWVCQQRGVSHLSFKTDGSVDGPEITTDGPVDASTFLRATKDVEQLEMEVDAQCSFHIHVGFKNKFTLEYSRQTKLDLYEYLIDHVEDLPQSVRDRWNNSEALSDGYFDISTDNKKYSFVHFHSQFNTLEFRCFGNITTAEEARTCLYFAMKAVQYAVRKQNKEVRSTIFNRMSTADAISILRASSEAGVSWKSPRIQSRFASRIRAAA